MPAHCRPARMPVLIVAVVVLLRSSQPAFAVRLVRFAASINGGSVLNASAGDHGEVADTVWWYLKRLEFGPIRGTMSRRTAKIPCGRR